MFLDLLRGQGFAEPNPRPMFPNPPGLLRLEPHSEGLRERIWWGAASNATAVWAAKLGMNLQSSTLKADETGEPFHVQQAAQIRAFRAAWAKRATRAEPRVSVSRNIVRARQRPGPRVLRPGRRGRRPGRLPRRGGPSDLRSQLRRRARHSGGAASPGRGDRRGRYTSDHRPEPAGRRLQRPPHRGDPDPSGAGARLALNLAGIAWLEELLNEAAFACVMVSHDRYFLENVATEIVELNRVYAEGLLRVKGSYSKFIEGKQAYLEAQSKLQDA
jgi:hypothetical protein